MLCLKVQSFAQIGYWCAEEFVSMEPMKDSLCLIQPLNVDLEELFEKEVQDSDKMTKHIFQFGEGRYLVKEKSISDYSKCYISPNYKTSTGGKAYILPDILLSVEKEHPEIIDYIKEKYKKVIFDIERTQPTIYKLNCSVFTSDEILQLVMEMSKIKGVIWCEPDMISNNEYTNPLYPNQYYLKNTVSEIDINVQPAWNISTGSPNIKVAVLDSGIDATHEDFGSNVLSGYTIGIENGQGLPIIGTPNWTHGTCCAGIIAAQNNLLGIRGIASDVKILPVNIRIETSSNYQIANAIRWAVDNGADVLSCSWALGNLSNDINSAITYARNNGRFGKGSVVVFAAGNNGSNVNVAYPARLDGVIAVGAIDKLGVITHYSQQGVSLNLVAPSNKIFSQGDFYTTTITGCGNIGGNYTSSFGGTSAACPQVAGVAALMLSIRPDLTESQVRNILQQTARDLGATGFDNTYGYGLVDAYAAVNAVAPRLSAPSTICTTATAHIDNLPTGYTVNWSVSNGCVQIISGQGTGTVTLQRTGSGWATLTATISYNGTVVKTLSQEIMAGTPSLSMAITPVSAAGEWGYWRSDLSGNKIEVDFWGGHYPGYVVDLYRINNDFSMGPLVGHWERNTLDNMTFGYYPQGWYYIEIAGVNDCGTSSPVGTEIECVDGSWGMFSFSYSPDSELLTVTLNPAPGSRQSASGCEIQLWSENTLLRKFKMSDGQLQIPMSGMKAGLYVIRAVTEDGKTQQQKMLKK